MSVSFHGTDLFGTFYGPDLPELAHLCTAVILGGEGGTLTLLGPVYSQTGEYMIVEQKLLDFDEDSVSYGGTTLLPVGVDLFPALDRMHPSWRTMVGVHVAPHLEESVREHLNTHLGARPWAEWRLRPRRSPLICRAYFQDSTWWPDEVPRDAFWLEGTLDQARALLGRLAPDHQAQVRDAANQPYTVVVSRDGLHRYALPHVEPREDDPWPPEVFVPVVPFEVLDLADLQTACPDEPEMLLTPEVLNLEQAILLYDTLRAREAGGNPDAAIAELAAVTWPIRILIPVNGEEGWIIREQAQGMEQYLWPVPAGADLRGAVQLSVIMRNLLHWGSTDVAGGGYDAHLRHALPRVSELNARALNAQPE